MAETPRHKWTGVLIGSLAVAFAFEINASQFRATSGGPSTVRAFCYRGTCTVTIQASPSADYLHAPRASSGVCASLTDSASGTSRSFFGQHVRVFTCGTSPQNPQARFSCQGTEESLLLYKGDVNMIFYRYAESENYPTHGTRQTSDCGPAGLLCVVIRQRNDSVCVEESITRDRAASPAPVTPQKVGPFIPQMNQGAHLGPLTVTHILRFQPAELQAYIQVVCVCP